jgi:hypothetical protein
MGGASRKSGECRSFGSKTIAEVLGKRIGPVAV